MIRKTDKRILILLILILIGIILTLGCCIVFINSPQKFSDVIPMASIASSYNITSEKILLYVLTAIGLISGLFVPAFKYKKPEISQIQNEASENCESNESVFFVAASLVSFAVSFVAFKSTAQLPAAILAVLSLIFNRKKAHETLCSYILLAYGIIGLYWVYAFCGGKHSLDKLLYAAAVIPAIPLFFKKIRHKCYMIMCMAGSVLSPLCLLVFFKNKYIYNQNIQTVPVPTIIKITVIAVILLLIVASIVRFNKESSSKTNSFITAAPIVSILAYNRFDGTGAIMPYDLHHPIENIISFHQIVEMGQKPFTEFIPISGLYSLFYGAFHYLFGEKGLFSNYYITRNLFFLFLAVVIAFLLIKITSPSYALLLALLFYMPSYNRYAFILPIALLLLNPKLFKAQRRWLAVWFITSLFHGLYYPVHGFAVFFAFIPMGIYQFVKYIRTKELLNDLKKWQFYFDFIVCLLLLILSHNYLIGLAKHVLVFSKNSDITEGLSRFGFIFPDWFFPIIHNNGIRLCMWYCSTFVIVIILLGIASLMFFSKITIDTDRKIKIQNPYTFLSLSAIIILSAVSFALNLSTAFPSSVFSRALGPILAVCALLLIFIFKEGKKAFAVFAFTLIVAISALFNSENTGPIDSNKARIPNTPYYYVPEGYIHVSGEDVPKLGEGYISENSYNLILGWKDKISQLNPEKSYMNVPYYGFIYLYDLKGAGTVELVEAKGYYRIEEAKTIANNTESIILNYEDEYRDPYFYKWLLTSGDYMYDSEKDFFIPAAKLDKEQILSKNKEYFENNPSELNLYALPSSWGNSIDTLYPILSEKKADYLFDKKDNALYARFEEEISGNDIDFIYMKINTDSFNRAAYEERGLHDVDLGAFDKYLYGISYNPDTSVIIHYEDDSQTAHSVYCRLSNGELLIPINTGDGWLLNNHKNISFSLSDGEKIIAPTIEEIKFLSFSDR